jgi:arylsulfatase A-like enzyme
VGRSRRSRAAALCAVVGVLGAGCGAPKPEKPPRPNVIFLLIDTLRADRLSSYGYARPTTSNLDAFAKEGLLFEQARSQAACTFPSVNSILTSRWPARFFGQPQKRIGIPEGFLSLPEILGAAGYRSIAVSASPIVRKSESSFNLHGGFDRGFEIFDESCFHRRADCLNRRANRYLNQTAEPFFLYLHYQDVHSPYAAPSPYREKFLPAHSAPDWVLAGNPQPLLSSLLGEGPKVEATPEDLEVLNALYDGELAYLDSQLGDLFANLRSRGLLDRSIVVIASDHGEEFMEHGRVLHCETQFETSIHVPLIIRLPEAKRRGRISALVENLDLVPTIADYLGLKVDVPFEGTSLRPLIERGQPVHPTTETLQYALRSTTDGQAKLIFDSSLGAGAKGRFALFDLVADPMEQRDRLTADPETYRRLRAHLEARLKKAEGDLTAAATLGAAQESERRLKSLGYLH